MRPILLGRLFGVNLKIIIIMKEPTGLSRSDGRRPDGLTLIPWQNGKSLTWDVTVAKTLADSYVNASANSAGAASEMAASRKSAKYADLPASYIFQPIVLETLSPMNSSAMEFFTVLGRKIGVSSGDEREGCFFAAAIHGYAALQCNFAAREFRWSRRSGVRTSSSSRFFVLISFLFNPRYLYY